MLRFCVHWRALSLTRSRWNWHTATHMYKPKICIIRLSRWYRSIGSRLGEANCLQSMGELSRAPSRFDAASESYDQALSLCRQIGDRAGEANCVRGLGDVACMQEQYAEAANQYRRALLLYREVGLRLGEAGCLWSMARLAVLQHNLNLAREASELAATTYSNIGLSAQAQQVRDEFTQSQP